MKGGVGKATLPSLELGTTCYTYEVVGYAQREL